MGRKASGVAPSAAAAEFLAAEQAAAEDHGPDVKLLAARARAAAIEAKYRKALQQIDDQEQQINFLLELRDSDRHVREWKRRRKLTRGRSTAVLVLSDWHAEENVDPETVGGMNEFNPTICERRVRRTVDRFVWSLDVLQRYAVCDQIVIAALGDLINGYIHEELEESNWLSPVEATLFVEELLQGAIDQVLRETKASLEIVTAFGNHGRTTKKKRVSTGWKNSYEWGMYAGMARRNQNPRVRWQVGKGYHNTLEVRGRRMRFHHGDAVNYQGGVGGPTIPINKAIAGWNRAIAAWNKEWMADLDVFGHFHYAMEMGNFILNGPLVGYAPYSVWIKADYQPPTQTMFLVDRDQPLPYLLAMHLLCEPHARRPAEVNP